MSADRLPFDETFLKQKLTSNPDDWQTRRAIAHGLFDKQAYAEAADILWEAPEIPTTDLDLAFTIRILAKARPRRAIRLIAQVLEINRGKAVQNMGMTNALLCHGMVLQAARFYSAALEVDPSMVNPDLEYFLLWSDDEYTMWGNFEKRAPKLSDLPWMIRDPKEALRLTSRVSLHSTPIVVPNLPAVPGEELQNEMYQQEATHNAKITPPPAVKIPLDSVNPKDRLFDDVYGAIPVKSPVVAAPAPAPSAAPLPAPATPASAHGFPAAVVFPDATRPAAPPTAPSAPLAPAAVSPVAPMPPIHAPAAPIPPVASPPTPIAAPISAAPLPPLAPTPPAVTPPTVIPPAPMAAVAPVAGTVPTGSPTRVLLPGGVPVAAPTRRLITPGNPADK